MLRALGILLDQKPNYKKRHRNDRIKTHLARMHMKRILGKEEVKYRKKVAGNYMCSYCVRVYISKRRRRMEFVTRMKNAGAKKKRISR